MVVSHENSDLEKRNDPSPPPVDFNNPALYAGIEWSTIHFTTPSAPTATSSGTPGNEPEIEAKLAAKGDEPAQASTPSTPISSHAPSSSGNDQGSNDHDENHHGSNSGGGGSVGSSSSCSPSFSCPAGQMPIRFSDHSDEVDWIWAKDGAVLKSGKTRSSCVCLEGSSWRINIGSKITTSSKTTLIEGNPYQPEKKENTVKRDFFDISYVVAYTYPVVCYSQDKQAMSGSNLNLHTYAKENGIAGCDDANEIGESCTNPGYPLLEKNDTLHGCWKCTLPSPFFGAASGAAYTYPYDDAGKASGPMVKGGVYRSPMASVDVGELIECCVGEKCPPNTFSTGGMSAWGVCERPDCKPCDEVVPNCRTNPTPGNGKRDVDEAAFEEAAPAPQSRKRHTHHHIHHHHSQVQGST